MIFENAHIDVATPSSRGRPSWAHSVHTICFFDFFLFVNKFYKQNQLQTFVFPMFWAEILFWSMVFIKKMNGVKEKQMFAVNK